MRRDPRFHQPDIRSTARSGRAFASGTRYPRRGLAPPSWQSCRKKPCRRWRAGWAGRLVMPGISAASTSPSPRGRYLACSVGGWGNGQHSRGCGCGGTGCQPVPEAPRGKKGGMLAREAGRGGRTQVCRVCGSFAALPGSRTCETGARCPVRPAHCVSPAEICPRRTGRASAGPVAVASSSGGAVTGWDDSLAKRFRPAGMSNCDSLRRSQGALHFEPLGSICRCGPAGSSVRCLFGFWPGIANASSGIVDSANPGVPTRHRGRILRDRLKWHRLPWDGGAKRRFTPRAEHAGVGGCRA